MRHLGRLLAALLLGFLVVPFVALALSVSPRQLMTAVIEPSFAQALQLSLVTSSVSLLVTVLTGTPLAWWLSRGGGRNRQVARVAVELPVVMPPAVIGVALLMTFGDGGLLGGAHVAFTTVAVVLAQVLVSSPFYVQAAANAFRRVDPELMLVARTLGASPSRAFFLVALPSAKVGLAVGASLAWARALGEFGATLVFAGNMTAVTQTVPLAIFSALERDVSLAVALSLVLALVGIAVLSLFRVSNEEVA